jgi:hypothetical protein
MHKIVALGASLQPLVAESDAAFRAISLTSAGPVEASFFGWSIDSTCFAPIVPSACQLRASPGMRDFLRSTEHLIRVVVILALGVAAFLLIRRAVIPAGFGKYGHFRPAALDDIRGRPIRFAGHASCEACHSDEAETKSKGKHAGVACEACHGPLANHAEDPGTVVPKLPDPAVLCVRCHEANSSKPKSFPQVVSAKHSGGVLCTTCHQPHNPLNAGGG